MSINHNRNTSDSDKRYFVATDSVFRYVGDCVSKAGFLPNVTHATYATNAADAVDATAKAQ